MAKNWSDLQAVAEVLREALKLPTRNKKTFLFIVLFTITLYFLVIIASIAPLLFILIHGMSGDGVKIKQLPVLLVLVAIFDVVLMSLVSLVSTVFTIYLSSMSYLDRDLTFKELCLKVKKIWIRPLVTWFYMFILSIVFSFPTVCLVLLVYLARGYIIVAIVGFVLLLVVSFINLYFSVVWMVSLVTSVLEDCNGFEAIRKAAKLVQGRKVVGLLLAFILAIPSSGVSIISLANSKSHQTPAITLLMAFVTLILATMIRILSMMVYTVFYFKRKESHGELVDIEEETGYSKVSTVALDLL